MIPPIILPSGGRSGPTHAELLYRAALSYSDQPDLQRSFVAGAKWEAGPGVSMGATLIISIVVAMVVTTIVSCIQALGDSYFDIEPKRNKWDYIFPMYRPAFRFFQWMKK